MNKNNFSILAISMAASLALIGQACGSAEKKDPKDSVKEANTEIADVKSRNIDLAQEKATALNEKLKRVSLEGFPSWQASVSTEKYDNWAKLAAPVINEVAKEVPDGYVLQITGHASSKGPADRNKQVSSDRAKYIYNAVKKQGVSTGKITYKGVGTSQPAENSDPESAENRRVSFQVVKK